MDRQGEGTCASTIPHIRLDLIYGSNRSFILNALPHIGKLVAGDSQEVLQWCECLVMTQKPTQELARGIARSGKPVVDLAGALLARAASRG